MPEEAAPLLLPLLALAGFTVAYALVYLSQQLVSGIMQALASVSSWIPVVGSITAGVIHTAERHVVNAMASWLGSIEAHIATSWHDLARWTMWLLKANVAVAEDLWHAVEWLSSGALTRDVTQAISRAFHAISHLDKTITRDIARTVHKTVTRVESLGHSVLPRIRRLEHAVDHALPRELTGLWGQTKALEDSLGRLWDRVRSLPTTADITAAIAAAIAALGLAGLDLLKCAEAGSLFSKRGCGMWSLLDDVLGLLADAVILADLCQALPLLEEGFAAVEGPLTTLIADAATAICAQPPSGWATFGVAVAPLPPAQTLGAIP